MFSQRMSKQIGYYYSDYGTCRLYALDHCKGNWVSNVCYWNPILQKYYSPNMKELELNGRALSWERLHGHQWARHIKQAHVSFVSV